VKKLERNSLEDVLYEVLFVILIVLTLTYHALIWMVSQRMGGLTPLVNFLFLEFVMGGVLILLFWWLSCSGVKEVADGKE
jgi:hypothetical protein